MMAKMSVRKLNNETLNDLVAQMSVPQYDRSGCGSAIVHIGVGGFHRAHQAVYLDRLFQKYGPSEWGICGVGLMPGDRKMKEALVPQALLYTVIERSAEQIEAYIVGSMVEYLFAPENLDAVLDQMAGSQTKIISLTITEGGYFYSSATDEFLLSDERIQSDLANPETPSTAIGCIVEGLKRRRDRKGAKVTILSCDNLPENGTVSRKAIEGYAQARDANLYRWIQENVSFPNSMVDRITPATTDADRQELREHFTLDDAWPVVTEPFIQWVIEDNFAAGRPNLEEVGVQFVPDVMPYELMKMQLLNASHSLMGYLGYLAGFEYIHEVASDREFRRYILRYMDQEVTPILAPVPGINLEEYKQTLLERFTNPKIKDQLTRICFDGSSKIPKFVLPVILKQLDAGGPFSCAALCIAAWFRYLTGKDEKGQGFEIDDPMAESLQKAAIEGGDSPEKLLAFEDLFSPRLRNSDAFKDEVKKWLVCLYQVGAQSTLRRCLKS